MKIADMGNVGTFGRRDDIPSSASTKPLAALDASTVEIRDFSVSALGPDREITAGFKLLDRVTNPDVLNVKTDLGESDMRAVDQIERYVYNGERPEKDETSGIFDTLNVGAAGTESREGRLKAVLEAGLGLLEAAKGPGLNALHIVGRTGTVIVLATLLREYVASLVEHARRGGPEAPQAWATVALAMTGPALILMGAIRRECAGEASWKSRLAAACLASAVVGSTIMAAVTGAASKLFPAMVGGVVYIAARAVGDSFFPLNDKTGPANAVATGVTAAAYGVVQGVLAELSKHMPLSGAARAVEGLGYDFGADAIKAGLNGLGMVVDVAILTLCKSWLSPQRGPDSPSFDPESLQKMVMEARATAQWPTRTQVANAFVNVAGTRVSYGHALALIGGAATAWLSDSKFGDDTQGHLLNGCLVVMMTLLYFTLIFANLKRTDNTFNLPQPTITP
ncbi:hypothetical protein [Pseudomonas sp. Tri1]|uniref:hypothetical protein n=1 Tax=Pseudomonas sp. Tri1 TaxID=2823875 RepID=UPI001B32F1C2|nr:hypothetical protein [Pseudomonas sp. Tri1]